MATQAINRAGAADPLAPVTTQLLGKHDNSGPVAVVWFSNRPRRLPVNGSEADRRLIDAAVAAQARISIVTTGDNDAVALLPVSNSRR